jgi:aldehyde:ferredoxin oxidoreductase
MVMSKQHGLAGKVAFVDLTNRRVTEEHIQEDVIKSFLGGYGINHKLAYDTIIPGTDPRAPENPIIFGAGALVGTSVPGASKIFATTKLPVSKMVGSPGGSMSFASMMKWAGYDHVVVLGKSAKPVIIVITDDKVSIVDAHHFWGRDVYDTTAELKNTYEGAGTICIGPAGEQLVTSALAMVDGITSLGRGGLGAVMGSKNVKALVALGTKGLTIADPKRFQKSIAALTKRMMEFKGREQVVDLGMMAGFDALLREYFCTEHLTPEQITKTFGISSYKNVKKIRLACTSCLVGCKDLLEFDDGESSKFTMGITSFINIPAFSTRFAINNLKQAAYIFNKLDRLGLCGQTLEGLLDFPFELYEHGLLKKKDIGFELKRDFETINKLIDMMIKREGFGEILAEGWDGIIGFVGEDAKKYSYTINGINVLWDPRLGYLGTMEFEQLVSPRGPYSAYGGSPTTIPNLPPDVLKKHSDRVGGSSGLIERIFDDKESFRLGSLTRCFEDWVFLMNCMGVCNRAHNDRYYSAALLAELYSAATGFDFDVPAIMKAVERVWTISRMSNVKEGILRDDDQQIPARWFKPLKTADGKEHVTKDYYEKQILKKEDVQKALDDYYESRGCEKRSGIPTAEKSLELGLNDFSA